MEPSDFKEVEVRSDPHGSSKVFQGNVYRAYKKSIHSRTLDGGQSTIRKDRPENSLSLRQPPTKSSLLYRGIG